MEKIIGRKEEIFKIQKLLDNQKAEFIAVYGRRRVGKTFLIRNIMLMQKKSVCFDFSGQKNASLVDQIDNFCVRLQEVFNIKIPIQRPNNWKNTLFLLNHFLQSSKNKKIIFFDELPWIASRNSGFLDALDYMWNQYWSKSTTIKLIVCGSAAAWMIDKILNAKGGLHNRVTAQISLQAFSFNEIEMFLKTKHIHLNRIEILKIYMAIGGVPFYWTLIARAKSSSENIHNLFFKAQAPLKYEFHRLFSSLFENSNIHENIIKCLAQNRKGMCREDLLSVLKLKSGGQFNRYLYELIVSGFIQEFIPYGRKKKDRYFRLIDPLCLFYLKWQTEIDQGKTSWKSLQKTDSMQSWLGYSFENLCIHQEDNIKKSLDLVESVIASSSWMYRAQINKKTEIGCQIDLLWKRKDGVIHIFEMKYSESAFKLEKSYAKSLSDKIDIFKVKNKFNGQIFLTLITPYGLAPGLWNDEVIDSVVTLNDLW